MLLSPPSETPVPGSKPLIDAILGRPLARRPLWLMRQAGRYLPEYRAIRAECRDFVALCLDVDRAVEVTLQPIRRFGMDGAVLFSDILMVPWALGQKLAFEEGEGPKLEPIRNDRDLQGLGSSLDTERLFPVYDSLRRLTNELPSAVTLIGFAGAPWTLATYMVEGGSSRAFSHVKSWAEVNPDGFQLLIDRVTVAVADHLIEQIGAGAQAVQIFDSWAGALDGEPYRRWVIRPNAEIVRRVRQRYPAIPIIGFPKGSKALYTAYVEGTGVDAVSVDTDVPLDLIKDRLQPLAAVQGLLDPALLVQGGPAMRAAVKQMLEQLGKGRYVFNLGHGVVPATPPDHVAELVDLVHSSPLPS